MRVACYERVSSKEQAMHGLSLGDQRKVLEDWCEKNGHVIVDHYCDAGVSGRMPLKKRPELLRMLEDVKNGKIQLVIFIKLDRFFRNVGQYFLANDVLEQNKVPWKAILEDYETETAAGRLKVTIMLGIAQNEAETTSERLKFTMAQKRDRGEICNGKYAYGTKIEGKYIVPNEDAENVAEIFKHYIQCRSIAETKEWSEKTFGLYMSYSGFKKMLNYEKYYKIGIITPETWKAEQEILKERSPRKPTNNNVYLFNGFIFCGECGRRLSGQARGSYLMYRCQNHYMEKKCPNPKGISENKVEKDALNSVIEAVDLYNARLKLEKQKGKAKPIDFAEIQRKKDKLADLYINDRISKEKYEKEYNKLDAILIQEPEKKEIDKEKVVSMLSIYQDLPKESKKQFWGSLIKKITVDNDKNITIELL